MEMTPIISPWFFYFAAKVEIIHMFAWILLFTALIFGAGALYEACATNNDEHAEDVKKTFKKPCIIVSIIMCLIILIVPTQNTLVQMLIAENITYERLEVVGETIEGVYEDILAITDKLVGTSEDVSK
jgi:hypothetical protein